MHSFTFIWHETFLLSVGQYANFHSSSTSRSSTVNVCNFINTPWSVFFRNMKTYSCDSGNPVFSRNFFEKSLVQNVFEETICWYLLSINLKYSASMFSFCFSLSSIIWTAFRFHRAALCLIQQSYAALCPGTLTYTFSFDEFGQLRRFRCHGTRLQVIDEHYENKVHSTQWSYHSQWEIRDILQIGMESRLCY